MGTPHWFPDWSGEAAVVVASGPSASEAPLDYVRGRAKVIAVNSSWMLCPWADVLYGCDAMWWLRAEGCPDFSGLKIAGNERAAHDWELCRITIRQGTPRMIFDDHGVVGWGGNSGFHAINLAVQFGARRIILVGFDMCIDRGLHWHGEHPAGMNNPRRDTIERWRKTLDGAAQDLVAYGVEVLNASPISTLTAYPVVDLRDLFA